MTSYKQQKMSAKMSIAKPRMAPIATLRELKSLEEIEYLQSLSEMSRSKQIYAARFFRATGEFYTFYLDAIKKSGLPQEFFNNALALQTKTITDIEEERNQSAESGGCIEHPIKWISCCLELMRNDPKYSSLRM
jgi:hypothetical protein